MDNRLTKKRLSDFLAYEWIITIIAAVAAIVVLEIVYTMTAVRLSVGQQFKYYMDEDLFVYNSSVSDLYDLLGVKTGENGKTFSFDVLSVESENLDSSYNVLSVRLSVQEGDAIFTSSAAKEDGSVRAKSVIDGFPVYDMQALLNSAKGYLAKFVPDGGNVYNENDYDENAIRAYFDKRMKGDNRFRTEEEKEEGRKNEIGRIKKLANDVKDFDTLMAIGEEKGLFYRYTKYEQTVAENPDNEHYTAAYANETERIYGLNMDALTGGNKTVSDYLKIPEHESAEGGVVLVLFDFSSYQYDLQFECISFVNTLVKEFSNFLE